MKQSDRRGTPHEAAGRSGAPLDYLRAALTDLSARGLLRTRPAPVPDVSLSFCSNDYLGLARSKLVGEEGAPGANTGAGASRLIVGERPEHAALESRLAAWLGTSSSLLFTSGYAANVGVLSALAEPGDVIVSDELNHASIIDGCRLSRARVVVTPHFDLEAVARALREPRAGRAWVVTESYFSMDADTPDLRALRAICDDGGAAMIVDEAHALGVFGPRGRGLCAEQGAQPDVLMGTLGKAFGVAGAFVAGSEELCAWLWNRARSFVFSTGISPLACAAALLALGTIEEGSALRARLHSNVEHLRRGLRALEVSVRGHGPIVPVLVGEPRRALDAAEALRRDGIHVQAVRPPTVPVGTSRLRLTTTSSHSSDDIERALRALAKVRPWLEQSS